MAFTCSFFIFGLIYNFNKVKCVLISKSLLCYMCFLFVFCIITFPFILLFCSSKRGLVLHGRQSHCDKFGTWWSTTKLPLPSGIFFTGWCSSKSSPRWHCWYGPLGKSQEGQLPLLYPPRQELQVHSSVA